LHLKTIVALFALNNMVIRCTMVFFVLADNGCGYVECGIGI